MVPLVMILMLRVFTLQTRLVAYGHKSVMKSYTFPCSGVLQMKMKMTMRAFSLKCVICLDEAYSELLDSLSDEVDSGDYFPFKSEQYALMFMLMNGPRPLV